MSKKLIIILTILFIFSSIVAVASVSYKNKKVENLNIAKANKSNNRDSIKNLKKEEINNQGFLHQIESHPNSIAESAQKKVEHFIVDIKSVQNKKDDVKEAYYKQNLKNYTTQNVISSPDLKDIKIPANYDIYINTSRGHYMQFLIKEKNNTKPKKYFTVNYNNITHRIESIKEYDVRS